MQLYRAGSSGESARPEFCPDPPARGTKSRPGAGSRTDVDDFSCIFFSLARRRRWPGRAGAGLRPRLRRGRDQEDREGRGGKAQSRRHLRRLERVREPDRQGAHLLCPCPAEDEGAGEPEARSGLRLHLRPPLGGRAQRGVVHHGLRRFGRGGHGSQDGRQIRREARGEGERRSLRRPRRRQSRRRSRSPRRLRPSARRPSTSCPRAPISG